MKRYKLVECFYSIQGEGVRAGIPHVFLRFSGCNLRCSPEVEGFLCDTSFDHGDFYELDDLLNTASACADPEAEWVLLTGGEPALQVDQALVDALHGEGWKVAIETNGTRELPDWLDWICVSPKPWAPVVVDRADEVKLVLAAGAKLDDRAIDAEHYLVSPAFAPCDHDGDCEPPACPGFAAGETLDNIAWCVELVKANPAWRLTTQAHKFWGIR